MSTPDKTDTQSENAKTQKSEPTFTDRVNEAVTNMVEDDKGVLKLADNLSEEVRVAAMSEKRYRDTQSAFQKTNIENKALKAEKSVLLQKAVGNVKPELTPEQTEELEDLKFSDPEAWRKKVNAYEAEALEKHTTEVNEEVKKVSTSSLEKEELATRGQVLKEFLESHKDFTLNDDILANDIPPRITNKLENGSIDFNQFLQECYEYVKTGKVVKQEDVPNTPNLSKTGGGSSPDKNAMNEDIVESYASETY